ncbi:MAG: MBL fold metallo-hydrolase [Bacteroidetes bacterium MedPE-SWsnd-G2]|nr:MAG: MBL fold metallo-hydrolase [Bacteroidetes bacterium MedPE-SWsnd-G2]
MKLRTFLLIYFVLFIGKTHNLQAQNFDNVVIKAQKVSEHVFMLQGAGGNIGVFVGQKGVFVIDDQFGALTPKIEAKIKTLSTLPLTYLVNTHFHGDHTGGNENMAKLGAQIIAHENVRSRLENTPKRDGTMAPTAALPIITFSERLNLFMDNEKIAVFHVDNAHTDGDAILYFTTSNVLHTGDTFFKEKYPYIDLKSGGTVKGYIDAVKKGLILIDENTKIIPGHGSLANKADYELFLKMLLELKTKVETAIANGSNEEHVAQDTTITANYDKLGYGSGFINSERIRRTFYKSLSQL